VIKNPPQYPLRFGGCWGKSQNFWQIAESDQKKSTSKPSKIHLCEFELGNYQPPFHSNYVLIMLPRSR